MIHNNKSAWAFRKMARLNASDRRDVITRHPTYCSAADRPICGPDSVTATRSSQKNPHARTLNLSKVRSPMKSYQGMPTVQFDVRVWRLCIEKGLSEPTSKGNNPNNFKSIAVKRDSPTVIRAYRIIVSWRTSYYSHCGVHFSDSGKLFNLAVSSPTPRAFHGTGKPRVSPQWIPIPRELCDRLNTVASGMPTFNCPFARFNLLSLDPV
jgi:hypothetical protein